MPEQLAFDHRFRDCAAVDRDKVPCPSLAVFVQGSGHQFLAGAGLAKDEDVGAGIATWAMVARRFSMAGVFPRIRGPSALCASSSRRRLRFSRVSARFSRALSTVFTNRSEE